MRQRSRIKMGRLIQVGYACGFKMHALMYEMMVIILRWLDDDMK
jgi:hypothetical protein